MIKEQVLVAWGTPKYTARSIEGTNTYDRWTYYKWMPRGGLRGFDDNNVKWLVTSIFFHDNVIKKMSERECFVPSGQEIGKYCQ